MEIEKFIAQNKKLQENILLFLDNDDNNDDYFSNLINFFGDQNICSDKQELSLIFHLITSISNNHHRQTCFFTKIEQILLHFRNDIFQYFTNYEIFNIFKSNKRILLFLIEEKIIEIDKSISYSIAFKFWYLNYYFYFFPEIKNFIEDQKREEIENEMNKLNLTDIEIFNKKRKDGENDNYICHLIRNDLLEEFIVFVNQSDPSILKMKIQPSLFETNSFLLSNEPNLIEYSAFFGSIQIFKYLMLNGFEINERLWLYSIHGRNTEIIHLLEEEVLKIENYNILFDEAIKCHHNEIADYIENNYFQTQENVFSLKFQIFFTCYVNMIINI